MDTRQNIAFVQLLTSNGTWQAFEKDWRRQCEILEEDFDSYAEATFAAVRDIIEKEHTKAGVYALRVGGKHAAMCQVNRTMLPGYDGYVLRIRFLTLSPEFDLTDVDVKSYANVLVQILTEVIIMSRAPDALSRHIKFHLRSPADQQFFSALGRGLNDADVFESVATRGAWLYITHK